MVKDISCFSANVANCFDNSNENLMVFNDLMMNAVNGVYDKYSKAQTSEIIRNQFNKILGIDYRNASVTQRRQAFRDHNKEYFSVIENILIDKMVSGIDEQNMPIMRIVEDKNIALGDINYFTVQGTQILQISKWASGHHDIISDNSIRIA